MAGLIGKGYGEKHGMRGTAVYRAWQNMMERCHNPKRKDYKDWGARGITVCEEWRKSFLAFYAHVGDRPAPSHTLDRIGNDRPYEPGNVRWATREQQSHNSRRPRWIEHAGHRLTLRQWAKRLGYSPSSIHRRLAAMPVAEALMFRDDLIKIEGVE